MRWLGQFVCAILSVVAKSSLLTVCRHVVDSSEEPCCCAHQWTLAQAQSPMGNHGAPWSWLAAAGRPVAGCS